MRLTTKSLHGSGRVVVLDSGFCVLSALIALKKVGVFAAGALIKKRRYWPKHVPGDKIDETKFKDKEVGSTDSLKGELDGVHYDILLCTKEPDYVMKIMSTYGRLVVKSNQKESKRQWVDKSSGETHKRSFHFTEPFSNHFDYRHIVDDHNNLRHQVPAIEESWATHGWATRVFQFILAITEVNCYLDFKYFVWKNSGKSMTLQEFRGELLGWALIDNEFIEEEESPVREKPIRRRIVEHDKRIAPPHAKKNLRENRTHRPMQGTSSTSVKHLDAKPKYKPIVFVLLGIGCVVPVTQIILEIVNFNNYSRHWIQ